MYSKNEILEIIFEKSVELMFVFNENGDIFGANPIAKRETGYGEKLLSMNIVSVFPYVFEKDENGMVLIEDEHYRMNHEIERLDTVIYCNNQTCFPVMLNYNKVKLDGNSIGICQAVDISERKAAIKQKKKAKVEMNEFVKVKNEFMANVTHELRTPLNGIKGLAGSLQDTNIDDEQKEIVDIILHCCDTMSKIINDILDVSKIEAGKLTIEKREFDFRKFIQELVGVHSHIMNEKGLKFIVNIGTGIPAKLIGDELRLGQVINNFMSNAIKFTSVGSVTLDVVKTFENENEIELFFLIIDTGIGLEKDEIDKLFVPFSQVDPSITRRFGGTGLGLSICKELVEMMDGSIHVESEPGKGSTFSFSVSLEVPDDIGVSEKNMQLEHNIDIKLNHDMDEYKNKDDILNEYFEKLSICIEMGTWGRAETMATAIKSMMPEDNKELVRAAFRIVLAVRKADYEKSVKEIKDMQEKLELL